MCCWRRLLRVPWTARRSNQSILTTMSPEYSLEGLMLKLKLQYYGHLMRRMDSLEKTLMLGKIEGGRRRGQQRMRWLDGHRHHGRVWINSRSWWWTGKPGMLWFMGLQKSWTWLSDWTVSFKWSIILVNLPQDFSHTYAYKLNMFWVVWRNALSKIRWVW